MEDPTEGEHAGTVDVASHRHPEHAEALYKAVNAEEARPEAHVGARGDHRDA